ncbi:MAG: hypothetical protein IKY26_03365 [Erysipelotrichaceae bacterium]|nr:hypothetical protein [Erysipelotrichaceae bacterium]
MRFLVIIIGVCKGITKGIRNEVKRLASISEINSLMKQRKEEVVLEYERLGEYLYSSKRVVEDEYVIQLFQMIETLLMEIESYEQQLTQLRDE